MFGNTGIMKDFKLFVLNLDIGFRACLYDPTYL